MGDAGAVKAPNGLAATGLRHWAPSPNERLPPYPGLLIPPLPAPERYDLSHHLTASNREAALRACCALLSITHLRLHIILPFPRAVSTQRHQLGPRTKHSTVEF